MTDEREPRPVPFLERFYGVTLETGRDPDGFQERFLWVSFVVTEGPEKGRRVACKIHLGHPDLQISAAAQLRAIANQLDPDGSSASWTGPTNKEGEQWRGTTGI